MDNTLDLLIQDFVSSNKLVNQNIAWNTLVSRQFENGRRKIFHFNGDKIARAEHVDMADAEWLVIELPRPMVELGDVDSLRFDCLKLMYVPTHYTMSVEKESSAILIRLLTRNRGLMNVLFKVIDMPSD
jgi:hypothetical protein